MMTASSSQSQLMQAREDWRSTTYEVINKQPAGCRQDGTIDRRAADD